MFALNFSACRKFDSTYFEYKAGNEKVECNTFCNPVGYYLSDKDETTIEICTEDDRQAMNIVIPEIRHFLKLNKTDLLQQQMNF